MPAANPAVFTATTICEELVMPPVTGDTETQLALSDAVQFVVLLFDFDTLTDWLAGLLPPCTARKLSDVGLAVNAHMSEQFRRTNVKARNKTLVAHRRKLIGHLACCLRAVLAHRVWSHRVWPLCRVMRFPNPSLATAMPYEIEA